MKRKPTIIALFIGLSLLLSACSKSGGSAVNMSDDDKHKLYQAGGMTMDIDTIMQVGKAIGITDSNGKHTDAYEQFRKDHEEWGKKNSSWVLEYSDKDKAKEYVKSHLPS